MELVGLVMVAALAQYFAFAFAVAGLRERLGVPATEPCSEPELVRAVRVHANTGEMLIVFLPLLALCGLYFEPRAAAGIGSLWIVARFVYRRGYLRDVAGRIPGFIMGDVVLLLLAVGASYGMVAGLVPGSR